MTRAREFSIQLLDEFDELVEEKLTVVVQKIAIEGLSRVVMKSPVDTGRFRGNWTVSINSESDAISSNTDPSGGPTIAAGSAVANGISMPQVIWLQNNLPYGPRLEDGYSKQSPTGMVAVTVAELQTMFARVE